MSSVQCISSSHEESHFRFIDTTPSFMNAIRRTLIDYIPTQAINEVTVHVNMSVLPEEFVAHRLGLLELVLGTFAFTGTVHTAALKLLYKLHNVAVVLL